MRRLLAASLLVALSAGAARAQGSFPAPVQTDTLPLQSIPALTAAQADPPASPNAVAVLLRQAHFWHDQYQNDRALAALNRALALDPANAEAAQLLARIEAEQGDSVKAAAALRLLRQTHPDDPAIAEIESDLRVGPIAPQGLAEARALARDGRTAAAIQRYNQLFKGTTPPAAYAVEYYQTLAGTEGGWDAARDGLAGLVRLNPGDLRAAVAYGELLTYREATRGEGIARLASLAGQTAVAETATRAWRRALLWLPVAPPSGAALSAFLQMHPDDSEIRHQLQLAQNPPQDKLDTLGQQRQAAFRQLDAGHLAEAENLFQSVLETAPDDADAVGGLGLVRLREGNQAAARSLLQRAISLDPANRSRWDAALAGASTAAGYASIRALTDHGDYAGAERAIRALMHSGGDSQSLPLMLANVQASSGNLAAAEATYRALLQRQPASSPALLGLAGVLERQGRFADAESILTRAGATASLRQLAQVRAERLRDQAAQTADLATRESLLQAAVAADPSSPWARLDLARALVKGGQAPRARAVMAELTNPPAAGMDALQAGILFDVENDYLADAAALAARVAPGQHSAPMRAALARLQVAQSIAAARLLPALSARARLLALAASQPDPDGTTGAAIARALWRTGDTEGARMAIATARAATVTPSADQALNYAAALLEIGDTAEAQAMLAATTSGQGLTPAQQAMATNLGAGLAVREADRLNQAGQQAAAYDVLAPALARAPDDPDLNLALGRLYQSADNPRRALAVSLAVLRRDPSNIDARRAAVVAALAAGDRDTAQRLVREAVAQAPDDPRVWLASADLAQAGGDDPGALSSLQHARDLRAQQIGADPAAVIRPAAAVTLWPGANPFRQGPGVGDGAPSGDPMTMEIDQSITALQDAMVPAIQGGVALRGRTGTSGLSSLTDVSLPLEASFSPGGVGRLRLLAQPVLLSAGSLGSSTSDQAQLGTQSLNVLPSATGGAPGFRGPLAGGQTASGVGLDLDYLYGWLNADIGTTPVGFPIENIIGGVQISPKLTDALTLRLTAERRAVTDSLLSDAGQRDPRTGIVSGGVVRSRAYAQLELAVSPANFYAGGGYDTLQGQNVLQNTEIEAGAGVGFPIYRNGPGELRSGLDLVYFGFDKNLGGFSFGQGGYFSPQSYFAALVPLTWSSKYQKLTYSIGGALGYQIFNSRASPYFAGDPALQAQLQTIAAGVPGLATSYSASNVAGLAGSIHGALEYQLTGNLRLGARASFQHAGDYSEGEGLLYARYLFNPAP